MTLAVFPRLVPVSTRWFLRNSWELETGARGFQDDRTVIRNVRAYQPGDNARSLNFRLMARGQGAMVNIYEKISPRRVPWGARAGLQQRRRVDFPLPERPVMPTIFFSGMVRLRSWSTSSLA